MIRSKTAYLLTSAILCGGLVGPRALAASLTEVPRTTWAGNTALPSYAQMWIYVPDKLAAKPPIVVSSHSCGNSASGQWGSMTKFKAMADKNGFLMILPDNPGQNCWDVGTKAALTHDGGGDPHAVATMVRYALRKYGGDSTRVYAVGGSSGAMMTQALLGVYPEMFVAGAPRAGVPCGCWAESYASSNQWSGPCAKGTVTKTAQQWGDLVRAINPGYAGHRPRVQIFHGDADPTIDYNNLKESVKEWTNVLGLATTPTTTDKITTSAYTYNRQIWKNTCGYKVLEAWTSPGGVHSMTYEEDSIIHFFGLDVAGGQDPELAACPSTGLDPRLSGTRPNLVQQGRSLSMSTGGADEIVLRLADPSGRLRSLETLHPDPNAPTLAVPLPSNLPGYHLASATFSRDGHPIAHAQLGVALLE